MVNRKQLKGKKKVGIQFQPRRRVEVANNKIRRLTMLIVENLKEINAPIWNRHKSSRELERKKSITHTVEVEKGN